MMEGGRETVGSGAVGRKIRREQWAAHHATDGVDAVTVGKRGWCAKVVRAPAAMSGGQRGWDGGEQGSDHIGNGIASHRLRRGQWAMAAGSTAHHGWDRHSNGMEDGAGPYLARSGRTQPNLAGRSDDRGGDGGVQSRRERVEARAERRRERRRHRKGGEEEEGAWLCRCNGGRGGGGQSRRAGVEGSRRGGNNKGGGGVAEERAREEEMAVGERTE